MLRHVVCWTLKAEDDAGKRAVFEGIKARVEPLVGVIPGLSSLTVGADIGEKESNWDVVLISEHDDADALEAYQIHPAHVEVAQWISTVVADRACVDAWVG